MSYHDKHASVLIFLRVGRLSSLKRLFAIAPFQVMAYYFLGALLCRPSISFLNFDLTTMHENHHQCQPASHNDIGDILPDMWESKVERSILRTLSVQRSMTDATQRTLKPLKINQLGSLRLMFHMTEGHSQPHSALAISITPYRSLTAMNNLTLYLVSGFSGV
ncbi:uncharacterized protein P174DRAFT_152797 [Aspergillus novofumigatus IBT 16806]|uniref:Uncharacterized protein n=1 Tax=Aspergillus novofumigatus (strain IBT 16806) TaxID=1392255 RepID=A0A2I1CEP5_ASPN1|nr:uncharacterized protein P174DRAFT_152797 [Aspergillus novofumigatus IBT 16806]PKX96107.1 hypothetical protein P174DRAFT_152797 [Aspergillus novofumigatus IBT 16806]